MTQNKVKKVLIHVKQEITTTAVIWLLFKFTDRVLLLYIHYLLQQTIEPPYILGKLLMSNKTNFVTPLERLLGVLQNRLGFTMQVYEQSMN